MTEWSVAVTNCLSPPVKDADDALERILESVADHGPALSYSPKEITLQITVRAESACDASSQAADVVAKALGSVGWPVDIRELHATERSLFEAQLDEPNFPELVGITEIAELLGTSRQRASELARSARFPRPLAELAAGPVWPKPWIARFVEEWERRPGRPRSTAATTS